VGSTGPRKNHSWKLTEASKPKFNERSYEIEWAKPLSGIVARGTAAIGCDGGRQVKQPVQDRSELGGEKPGES